MAQRHYTTEDVAAMYDVTSQTVRNWIASGRLEAINIGSADRVMLRVTDSALAAFTAVNAVAPKDDADEVAVP